MSCETCGYIIIDYMISLVEDYQFVINQLKQNPVPKNMVNILKSKRDKLLKKTLSYLNHDLQSLERELLHDRAISIEERLEGKENAIVDVHKEELSSICAIS